MRSCTIPSLAWVIASLCGACASTPAPADAPTVSWDCADSTVCVETAPEPASYWTAGAPRCVTSATYGQGLYVPTTRPACEGLYWDSRGVATPVCWRGNGPELCGSL